MANTIQCGICGKDISGDANQERVVLQDGCICRDCWRSAFPSRSTTRGSKKITLRKAQEAASNTRSGTVVLSEVLPSGGDDRYVPTVLEWNEKSIGKRRTIQRYMEGFNYNPRHSVMVMLAPDGVRCVDAPEEFFDDLGRTLRRGGRRNPHALSDALLDPKYEVLCRVPYEQITDVNMYVSYPQAGKKAPAQRGKSGAKRTLPGGPRVHSTEKWDGAVPDIPCDIELRVTYAAEDGQEKELVFGERILSPEAEMDWARLVAFREMYRACYADRSTAIRPAGTSRTGTYQLTELSDGKGGQVFAAQLAENPMQCALCGKDLSGARKRDRVALWDGIVCRECWRRLGRRTTFGSKKVTVQQALEREDENLNAFLRSIIEMLAMDQLDSGAKFSDSVVEIMRFFQWDEQRDWAGGAIQHYAVGISCRPGNDLMVWLAPDGIRFLDSSPELYVRMTDSLNHFYTGSAPAPSEVLLDPKYEVLLRIPYERITDLNVYVAYPADQQKDAEPGQDSADAGPAAAMPGGPRVRSTELWDGEILQVPCDVELRISYTEEDGQPREIALGERVLSQNKEGERSQLDVFSAVYRRNFAKKSKPVRKAGAGTKKKRKSQRTSRRK